MEVTELAIPGVRLIRPIRHGDARGFFSETYSQARFAEAGIATAFVQDNFSLSVPRGVVRGLHFQIPPFAQAKLVRVQRGAVLDVVVDIRLGSPTYGSSVAVELSADNWSQLYVPEGLAHGFCTLAPETEVTYKVSAPYSATHDRGLLWCDPALDIDWPVRPDEALLSEKDGRWPTLADLPAYFAYPSEPAA